MADTSRIRPWTVPVTAIAAALSLAACSSSGSGGSGGNGGNGGGGPTEPWEIALAAEAAAEATLAPVQAVVDEAFMEAHDYDGNDAAQIHQYDADLNHVRATGGDSGVAMERAQAVLNAVIAAQAVVDGIRNEIGRLSDLRDKIDREVDAAAARGDDAAARRLAFDARLYDESIAKLQEHLATAQATKMQADTEAREVEAFLTLKIIQYDHDADGTPTELIAALARDAEDEATKGVDLIGTMTGVVVHEAIIKGNDDRTIGNEREGLIRGNGPAASYPRTLVSREWDTSTGFTAMSYFQPYFETVTDETGTDIQALSLAGRPAADLGNPRFVPSDDDDADRLNADGTGWIMADGTEVFFAPGDAVPGDAYYEGLLIGGGGDVFCLGACSVDSNGVLQGDWWGKFDAAVAGGRTAETLYRAATAEELADADAPAGRRWVPDTTPFLQYGFWLNDLGTTETHVAVYVREVNVSTRAFNLALPDTDNESVLDDEASATYSGQAVGMSVRIEGSEGEVDPDDGQSRNRVGGLRFHSGRFLADAELTATFAGANTELEGTINNFRADGNPDAVNADWEVTLDSHVIGANGDSTKSGLDAGGDTTSGAMIDGAAVDGKWSGKVYGADADARPTGVYGVFDAIFEDGKAYGLFQAPYGPAPE